MEEELLSQGSDVLPLGVVELDDPRDYFASHILGAIPGDYQYPNKVRLDFDEGNQGADPRTKVACTCYSANHAAQYANELEHQVSIDPDFFTSWDKQGEYGTRTANGDYVLTALKNIRDNGLITEEGKVFPIEGFARIERHELKYYLAEGFVVITSADTTATNFKNAKSTGYWTGKDGVRVGGHAFVLTGYEAGGEEVVASNSYGKSWGYFKDGTFRIKEAQLNDLGSMYVLFDKKDLDYLFKDVTNESWAFEALKWAKENGVVNGYGDGSFRPNQPITRAEMVQVLYNYEQSKK